MNKHLFAAIFSASTFISTGVMAADVDFPHLETTGMGEVIAKPDMAVFSVQVSETRKTAKEAKEVVDNAIAAFNGRLKNEGVARTDIESSNISLRPEYRYKRDQEPKLIGYQASRQVTVTVRDLNKLNNYLDGALGDGINNINNIQLKVSNEPKFIELARQAAILDAKEKAQSLAKGFDEKVDGVWKITYRSSQPRPMLMRSMLLGAAADVESSYQDDKIIIRDQVDVVFRLED
ncbi:oxidative stress defense protein [Moritella sp. 36]|uniref:oxidative stress defense protein n=1 Tax=Moritella sp. 36 TaxID=2746233 RepID=UPI001BAAE03B|nr:oxidative stress defense protein [Moritella sp. 36]QUM89357.1 oxidative stress defense protein [Moritella sp. 36]